MYGSMLTLIFKLSSHADLFDIKSSRESCKAVFLGISGISGISEDQKNILYQFIDEQKVAFPKQLATVCLTNGLIDSRPGLGPSSSHLP